MNMDDFRRDLNESALFSRSTTPLSVDTYLELFESEVLRVLDKHAPLQRKAKRQGAHDGRLLSKDAREAKRTCRRLERRFRRTGSSVDRAAYVAARSVAREKITASRADLLSQRVAATADDPKKMWSTTRQLLHSAPPTDLHDVDCKEMANSFSSYFVDKIADIRKQIRSALKLVESGVSVATRSRTFTGTLLSAFDVVTVDEVIKLINSLPNKSSPLDVLPTSLLKSSCDIFAPAIAHLANLSFSSGTFPTSFKMAQVLPLLKK